MRFSHVIALAGAATAYVVPVDTVTGVTTPAPYSNYTTATVYPVVPTSKTYPSNQTTTPSAPTTTTTPTGPPPVTGGAIPQNTRGSLAALMVLVAAGLVVL
ncbi:hypothetical protein BKA56DRAFT_582960 [Ilyonectria sp. MPI-CAGE-AT-0026]|nr:hypothetical protein BKA56DRAFT_582960 [Ilyonectria sp. MPI-CAGE-AT-0026]